MSDFLYFFFTQSYDSKNKKYDSYFYNTSQYLAFLTYISRTWVKLNLSSLSYFR